MFIERLNIRELLSFGSDGIDLPLEPLNVIIGPNGSGKSNLLQTLALLRATAGDLATCLGENSGWSEWVWQGPTDRQTSAPTIAATITLPQERGSIKHLWGPVDEYSGLIEEWITFHNKSGESFTSLYSSNDLPLPEGLDESQSIISQLHRLPDCAKLHWLRKQYAGISLYRNWTFGALAPQRSGQSAELRNDVLDEGTVNLANVISRFSHTERDKLTKYLRRFYGGFVGISAPVHDGKVSLVVEESQGRQIPANRLSDGTLRYLSLLTILLDPAPPPLIGIEEPELGLHPDVVFDLARLLVDASQRTQLILTTHSPTLIDSLTDYPSSVVVCDKYDGQTRFKRLDPEALEAWKDEPGLGDVWCAGGIGGNPW